MSNWQTIKKLKEDRAALFAEDTKLRDTANAANRDLTAEEETRHVHLIGEITTLGKRIDREIESNVIGDALADNRSAVGREDIDPTKPRNSLGMKNRDFERYSLVRAINCAIDGKAVDGVEGEVSKELEKRHNKAPRSFYFPTEAYLPVQQRTIFDTTQGAGAVPTITSPNFIEILRNRMVVMSLGATMLPDMMGKFSIPKQTQASTAYWVADAGATTASYPIVGQVAFSPQTVGTYTDISRQLLKNSIFSAEDFVRNDLAKVLAIELDRATLFGSGSSNQPLGVVTNITTNYTGQIHSQGTNGGALAFTDVVALETLVANANADVGKLAYITNSKVRGALKTTPKSTSAVATGFVFEDNQVNGYPVGVSNNVPSNGTKGTGTNLSTMLFGDISSIYIALWGGLDVLVDPYTGGSAGTVRIDALQDATTNTRHIESFAVVVDAIA